MNPLKHNPLKTTVPSPDTCAAADRAAAATAASPAVAVAASVAHAKGNAATADDVTTGLAAPTVGEADIVRLAASLRRDERSEATVEKYVRDARKFAGWLEGRPLELEQVVAYKQHLVESGAAPATVNVKLAAVNALLAVLGRLDCRARNLRVQRRVFRDAGRDLGRDEYLKLVRAAYDGGNERLGLLMETICATGIRVSELCHITAEAFRSGRATICCKGKVRIVLLPAKLVAKLRDYARRKGIERGSVCVTRGGKPLSRRQIWGEMKALCATAGVEPSKVFPHNLRHLFAVEYYSDNRDIVKLADLLGHSSIDTTRTYLIETGAEHQRHLDAMNLVLWPPDAARAQVPS